MKYCIARLTLGLAMGLALALPAGAGSAPESGVTEVTQQFLRAYAAGDERTVLSLVSDDVAAYGSDVAEVVDGKDALRKLLADDARLWRGSASIGAMQHVSLVRDGRLASLVFDAPFRLADRPAIVVRFSMLWREEAAGWRLLQSSNAVPTVGRSAAELTAGHP